ncbi:hypothetical protein CMO83_01260 [Candidatus Woesearchaeota archaeon]|jgi:hypothetical protein|nr:hypothetical protein [Candidatus Woesearchaeota archaeon]|tara:strand:+ start:5644 stop:6207 length:564 start_codon:yes stop_codon:yes gene_type:complete
MVKDEIRVIGIDDSPFNKFKDKKILVVGVVMRGGSWIDGILSTKAAVDGSDATKNIIKMINRCKFKPQLQCIFLDGIAVGGFNIIDVQELNKKTKLPVIVVIRRKPDIKNIKSTLIRIKKKEKIKLLEKAGEVSKIGDIFVQLTGIDLQKARKILKIVCTRSFLPEPIRLAHLIAQGVVAGESKGSA